MNRSIMPCAIAGLVLLLGHSAASAQDVGQTLQELDVPSSAARRDAFYRLFGGRIPDVGPATERLLERNPPDRERISEALIRLLERENMRLQLDPPVMAEADGSYYGDLVWAVARLRHPAAVGALMPAIGTGRIAREGLADLGAAAMPALVTELRSSSSPRVRSAVAITLGTMAAVEPSGSSSGTVREVRASLLLATEDPDPDVRLNVVEALINFSDAEVRRTMLQLNATDPYSGFRDGQSHFPVREAAAAWLRIHGP